MVRQNPQPFSRLSRTKEQRRPVGRRQEAVQRATAASKAAVARRDARRQALIEQRRADQLQGRFNFAFWGRGLTFVCLFVAP